MPQEVREQTKPPDLRPWRGRKLQGGAILETEPESERACVTEPYNWDSHRADNCFFGRIFWVLARQHSPALDAHALIWGRG
jgi:hypothetical protein